MHPTDALVAAVRTLTVLRAIFVSIVYYQMQLAYPATAAFHLRLRIMPVAGGDFDTLAALVLTLKTRVARGGRHSDNYYVRHIGHFWHVLASLIRVL